MEEDDMIGSRQLAGRAVEPILRLDTPGCRELGVDINRTVEAYCRENVGQGVHNRKSLPKYEQLLIASLRVQL
jgi:hypothetical protein